MCFSISSAQLHTWGSWWQNDVPCAARTYIHTGDTDVFVSLPLYSELERPWPPRALAYPQYRSILPLYDICSALGNDLIKCLPAVHALTRCDTTRQLSLQPWKLLGKFSFVINFISPQLTESSMQMAETFPNIDLMTCTLLHSIAMWRTACTSTNARNTSIELTTKYSCGSKHHLEMPSWQWNGFERRGFLRLWSLNTRSMHMWQVCLHEWVSCRVAGIKCCKSKAAKTQY